MLKLKTILGGIDGKISEKKTRKKTVSSWGNIKKSTMQTKLNEVISGKRAISADFAVLMSKVLKSSPKMWMNLQVQLDIWEAELKAA